MPKATFTESAIFPEIFLMFTGLTKQVTFCNANTGFPAKCHEEMLPGSVWCFKLVCCVRNKFTSTNPKHYIIFSVYTPLKIAVYYCTAVPVSVNKFNILFSYSPSYNPLNLIQYSSLTSTFFKRLAKCLSCFALICACGTLEGVVILFYSF